MITAAVEAAAGIIPATCLTQALAAQFLLARAGHRSAFRIGVMTIEGKLKAHAWLEQTGGIVIGRVADIDQFKPLPLSSLTSKYNTQFIENYGSRQSSKVLG